MALTRKLLKGMGLTDEQVDTIIEAHSETVDGLKDKARQNEEAAKKLPDVQKELDDLKAAGDGGYKEKYEKEHRAFEEYKADVSGKELTGKKKAALDALLKESGVQRDSFRSILLKGWDLSKVELDDSGKIKDAETITNTVKTDYADFVATTTTSGTPPITPPTGGKAGGMTKKEIMAIRDPEARQAEIIRNPAAFGLTFTK